MQDLTNAVFELGGGLLIFLNCLKLYKDKEVKGISIGVVGFFTLWGCWNLYYYPFLNQWLSFAGGLLIVIANTLWVSMALYYGRRKNVRAL